MASLNTTSALSSFFSDAETSELVKNISASEYQSPEYYLAYNDFVSQLENSAPEAANTLPIDDPRIDSLSKVLVKRMLEEQGIFVGFGNDCEWDSLEKHFTPEGDPHRHPYAPPYHKAPKVQQQSHAGGLGGVSRRGVRRMVLEMIAHPMFGGNVDKFAEFIGRPGAPLRQLVRFGGDNSYKRKVFNAYQALSIQGERPAGRLGPGKQGVNYKLSATRGIKDTGADAIQDASRNAYNLTDIKDRESIESLNSDLSESALDAIEAAKNAADAMEALLRGKKDISARHKAIQKLQTESVKKWQSLRPLINKLTDDPTLLGDGDFVAKYMQKFTDFQNAKMDLLYGLASYKKILDDPGFAETFDDVGKKHIQQYDEWMSNAMFRASSQLSLVTGAKWEYLTGVVERDRSKEVLDASKDRKFPRARVKEERERKFLPTFETPKDEKPVDTKTNASDLIEEMSTEDTTGTTAATAGTETSSGRGVKGTSINRLPKGQTGGDETGARGLEDFGLGDALGAEALERLRAIRRDNTEAKRNKGRNKDEKAIPKPLSRDEKENQAIALAGDLYDKLSTDKKERFRAWAAFQSEPPSQTEIKSKIKQLAAKSEAKSLEDKNPLKSAGSKKPTPEKSTEEDTDFGDIANIGNRDRLGLGRNNEQEEIDAGVDLLGEAGFDAEPAEEVDEDFADTTSPKPKRLPTPSKANKPKSTESDGKKNSDGEKGKDKPKSTESKDKKKPKSPASKPDGLPEIKDKTTKPKSKKEVLSRFEANAKLSDIADKVLNTGYDQLEAMGVDTVDLQVAIDAIKADYSLTPARKINAIKLEMSKFSNKQESAVSSVVSAFKEQVSDALTTEMSKYKIQKSARLSLSWAGQGEIKKSNRLPLNGFFG